MPRFVLLLVCLLGPSCLAAQGTAALPDLVAHDNRTAGGTVRADVLTIDLRIVRGTWRPDRDDDPGLSMLAFGEVGKPASIPGPLIRVTTGTRMHVRVHNQTDSVLIMRGFGRTRAVADTAVLAVGATREFTLQAGVAGNYLYAAQFLNDDPAPQRRRFGEDRLLSGAFIVDEPGARTDDRVLVLGQLVDDGRIRTPLPSMTGEVLTINGKSWPHTERLAYDIGDTIRWRVINASYDVHPMHLHGFYFQVTRRGTFEADTAYTTARVRMAVTERMLPFTTMSMVWVPDRPGNWLFHCHLAFHIMPHGVLDQSQSASPVAHAHPQNHALEGMAGLVLGTHVRGVAPVADAPRRQLRLLVHQRDSLPGHYAPPFGFALHQPGSAEPTAAQMTIPGPPLVLWRGEPTAITVVNRTTTPTSVHWHGVELESYYDGVSGFGGTPGRVTPAIAAGDSFVVHVTPPRAGTFIYHSHFEEVRQQQGGMFGAFIVLDPGTIWDPAHDRPIVISTSPVGEEGLPLVNGDSTTVIRLKAGDTYRLRFINITLDRPNLRVALLSGDQPAEWVLLAKDGADLPASQAGRRAADMNISIGETYDVRFTSAMAGEFKLELRRAAGAPLRSIPVLIE